MQKWGKKYPHAGYGGRFRGWLGAENPKPYGSYGNGSAMRVSATGWLFNDLETTRHMARLTAEVTHNHPEGIKGAEATASAIFLARTGKHKEEIRDYIVREFGYDLTRTCDEIRPTYHHDESCQRTVPGAITAFLEGTDFEDVIRTAVSLGGDCDTLTCIAGGIAEAFYGVPDGLIAACRDRLSQDILQVVDRFRQIVVPVPDSFLNGNELIDAVLLSNRGKAAGKEDWETKPMPDQHATFTMRRHISPAQMHFLRQGNIPQEMEDKWFWYMEENTLYAHRSWTGICIFILQFDPDSDEIHVLVNRHPEQYTSDGFREDEATINSLLDWWCQPHYDYYNEWISETLRTLEKQGRIPNDAQ